MARTWDEKNNDLQIKQTVAETADAAYRAGIEAGAKALQIVGTTRGPGGSPGQSYQRPLQNPDPGEAVFGVEKDGQTFFEFLKAMGIFFPVRVPKNDPNKGKAPYDDEGNELSAPVPGHSDWAGTNKDMKIAHGEGRGPQQKFHDEYNRPLNKPPWRHINPRGEPIDIDWQKKEYMEKHPQFFPEQQANMKDSIQRENVGGTLRDLMLPLLIKEYGKDSGGNYKNPSKLLSGMKKLVQVYRGDLNLHPRLGQLII